ncbi:four helix bundle protein [Nitratifractor salsuginis]|uniref:four helix bundle protein n=1 Tax=Nitratifractor salsuginis TaxID=269261 RepID=UPI0002FE25A8|nr:four helix bundle protein [Nitratifractor salsuginis]
MKCERLDVWKRACRLSVDVYRHLSELRDFAFKDQITRSALSIASNIAEGIEKDSNREKVRFIERDCKGLCRRVHHSNLYRNRDSIYR